MSENLTIIRGLLGIVVLFGAANPQVVTDAGQMKNEAENLAAAVAGYVSNAETEQDLGDDRFDREEASSGGTWLARGLEAQAADSEAGPTQDYEKILRGEAFHKEFTFSEWENRLVRCVMDFDGNEGRFGCTLEGDGPTDMPAKEETALRAELESHANGKFYRDGDGQFCFEEAEKQWCTQEPWNDDRGYGDHEGEYRNDDSASEGRDEWRHDDPSGERDRYDGRDHRVDDWSERHGDIEEIHRGNYHEFRAPDGVVRCSSYHDSESDTFGCRTEGTPCFPMDGPGRSERRFCPPSTFTCVDRDGSTLCRNEETGETFEGPRDDRGSEDGRRYGHDDRRRDYEGSHRADGSRQDRDRSENHGGRAGNGGRDRFVNVQVTVVYGVPPQVSASGALSAMPCIPDGKEGNLPRCGDWNHRCGPQPMGPDSRYTCREDESQFHEPPYGEPSQEYNGTYGGDGNTEDEGTAGQGYGVERGDGAYSNDTYSENWTSIEPPVGESHEESANETVGPSWDHTEEESSSESESAMIGAPSHESRGAPNATTQSEDEASAGDYSEHESTEDAFGSGQPETNTGPGNDVPTAEAATS